jgi:hypothetical protein
MAKMRNLVPRIPVATVLAGSPESEPPVASKPMKKHEGSAAIPKFRLDIQ